MYTCLVERSENVSGISGTIGRNKIAEDIIAGLSNRVLAIPKMLDELTQTERYAKGEDHVNAQ